MQRVVQNLLQQSIQPSGPVAKECTVVHDGHFWPYDPRRPFTSSVMREDVLAFLPAWVRRTSEAVCQWTGSKQARKLLLPRTGKLGVYRPWHWLQEKRDRRALCRSTAWRPPGEGDVLLMADAYWCCRKVWPAVEEARRRGALVATVIYDLIPLQYPKFVRPGSEAGFRDYFQAAVSHSDMLIAISQTVAEDCRAEVARHWPDKLAGLKFDHFRLGSDLPVTTGQVSPHVRELFDPRGPTPYLMVSTFDPRKNHGFLLDCFEQFWKRVPDAKLCMVGSAGWMSADLIERIDNHPRLNKDLFKFHSLNDTDLKFCYQNARAVLCPSIVEGFGLSVVEAQAHGRRTFVSDTPVHREVGGEGCEYFALDDPADLATRLVQWESLIAQGARIEQPIKPVTNWSECARELFGKSIGLLPTAARQSAA